MKSEVGSRRFCPMFRVLSSVLWVVEWRSVFFFFFFSSRRRHTRSLRDWSSDVCSSDLPFAFFISERLMFADQNALCAPDRWSVQHDHKMRSQPHPPRMRISLPIAKHQIRHL